MTLFSSYNGVLGTGSQINRSTVAPPPPNAAGVGTDKKQRDKEIGGIGSHIDPTKPLSGTWKWAAVLGGGGILTHVEMRR